MLGLRRSAGWLLAQLLPPACPLCRKTFPYRWTEPFCPTCLPGFHALPAAHCPCCALPFLAQQNSAHLCGRFVANPPFFSKVHAVGCYDSSLRDAIHLFKFNNRVSLDRPLGNLLARSLAADLAVDVIVPVPLHFQRLAERSYNQALLLARDLGRRCRLPVAVELLVKASETVAQQGLSARQRERNLNQVFTLRQPLHGERVLLVDDVMTTGATVRACSRVLRAGGAGAVEVAIIGRA